MQIGSVKLRCNFVITLLSISYKIKENAMHQKQAGFNKNIMIKIGLDSVSFVKQKQAKSLEAQVIYSRTMDKFCPLKGIIKIYDIQPDGNNIISCVGAFNTDDLLCYNGTTKIINKQIGPIILEMQIQTIINHGNQSTTTNSTQNLIKKQKSDNQPKLKKSMPNNQIMIIEEMYISTDKSDEHKDYKLQHIQEKQMDIQDNIQDQIQDKTRSNQAQVKRGSSKDMSISIASSNFFKSNAEESQPNKSSLIQKLDNTDYEPPQNITQSQIVVKNFMKSVNKASQVEYGSGLRKALGIFPRSSLPEESSINNKSGASMSSLSFPQLFDEYHNKQIQTIGQQLVKERRKNFELQQRMQKMYMKIISYKKKIQKLEIQSNQFAEIHYKFLLNLQRDCNGQYKIEINQKKHTITLKFKPNIPQIQSSIAQFFTFLTSNSLQNQGGKISSKSSTQSKNLNISQKIQNVYQENIKQRNSLKSFQTIISQLKQKNVHLQKRIVDLSNEINEKNQKLYALEMGSNQFKDKIHAIEGVNAYLKEKDQQMEYIISTKQNTIENLRKMLSGANNQLDELEDQNIALKKTFRNCELMIEELKEEIANRDDTIEMYLEKYGEIKYKKNRQLQNQINDCLRWLNQESKIEDNSLDQTQRSDITVKKDRTLSSIVKNNQKIKGLGEEEVLKVKEELTNLLHEVEEAEKNLKNEDVFKKIMYLEGSNSVCISQSRG